MGLADKLRALIVAFPIPVPQGISRTMRTNTPEDEAIGDCAHCACDSEARGEPKQTPRSDADLAEIIGAPPDQFTASPSTVSAEVWLCLELAQFDHPRWLADATGIPLDELLTRLEASPHAAKGRPYRERLGLAGRAEVPPVSPRPNSTSLFFTAS